MGSFKMLSLLHIYNDSYLFWLIKQVFFLIQQQKQRKNIFKGNEKLAIYPFFYFIKLNVNMLNEFTL